MYEISFVPNVFFSKYLYNTCPGDGLKILEEYIDLSNIPVWLGGTADLPLAVKFENCRPVEEFKEILIQKYGKPSFRAGPGKFSNEELIKRMYHPENDANIKLINENIENYSTQLALCGRDKMFWYNIGRGSTHTMYMVVPPGHTLSWYMKLNNYDILFSIQYKNTEENKIGTNTVLLKPTVCNTHFSTLICPIENKVGFRVAFLMDNSASYFRSKTIRFGAVIHSSTKIEKVEGIGAKEVELDLNSL